MRVHPLAAWLAAAATLLAAPGSQAVTKFQTTQEGAGGVSCDASTCATFNASSASFSDGTKSGSFAATFSDQVSGDFAFLSCSGPELADIVSVSPNGVTTVRGSIDAASSSCLALNVGGIVTVNLSGAPDGSFSSSQHATGTIINAAISQRFNAKDEGFGVAFTGSNGLVSGNFSGSSNRSRRVQIDK